jgi:thiamine biosynthesis lipoprotein
MNRIAIPLDLDPGGISPPVGPVVTLTGPTMGVSWVVQAVLPPGLSPAPLTVAIQDALNAVVLEMSPWEPDSHISRFNRASAGWHDLPDGFFTVMDRALALAADSDGAFDPAIGALTDLWGFGPPGEAALPGPAQIASARAATADARSGLILDRAGRRLWQPGGVRLDLSAIAKGFGVDEAARVLRQAGVADFLVEIGGEFRGEGVRSDAQPWWVGIETPPAEKAVDEPILVALHGLSLATSGDYRRFRMDAGRRRSHTIDPRTGEPVESALAAVSVLAKSCMEADGLCTVLSVMPVDEALAWAEARGVAALMMLRAGGGIEERMTPAFAAMLED